MVSQFEHKEYIEQVDVLKDRNMYFSDEEKACKTLAKVPYYKIKEFARPFSKQTQTDEGKQIDYQGTSFESILSRYFQDKNLRIQLLHVLDEIEVALKTQTSYVLGRGNLGAYQYLEFNQWCDKEEYCKHYLKFKEREFQNSLKAALYRNTNAEIKEKMKADKKKFPPVWLSVDLLTFGQLVNLIELMSYDNKKYIADIYGCNNLELISWLKCINLIRNICAHNSNFIDTKLKTTPIIKDEWKDMLFKHQSNVYSNRIALPILIILYMNRQLNPKYRLRDISVSLNNLIKNSDLTAKYYGFADLGSYRKALGK